MVTAIPAGTTLRALFIDAQGTAYVDLSREVSTGHPGGVNAELLTVYTIVEALTTNLPAVNSVQVLVDGKEVDTLAGHVDIRRPLPRNDEWVVSGAATDPAAPAAEGTAPPAATADTAARLDAPR
jgi:spore germination protein GerM